MKTLVTIMIPTYNQDQYLEDAVDSAIAQTYPHKQILVLDDSSTDNTEAVMKKYQEYPDVSYIRNTVNVGRVENYKTGLYRYAKGDWVINLDGDDFFIDNSFIDNAIKITENDPKIVLISADRIEVFSTGGNRTEYEKNSQLNKVESTIVDGNIVFMGILKRKYHLYHLTSLYKREVAQRIGFYRKNIISSDYESLYRLILGNKVAFIKSQVAAWRSHGENESRNMDVLKLISNYELFTSVYMYARENDYLNCFKRKKWLINASANRFYTSIISLSKSKSYKDLLYLSKYLMLNFPFAFIKTIFNPKLYLKLLVSRVKKQKKTK